MFGKMTGVLAMSALFASILATNCVAGPAELSVRSGGVERTALRVVRDPLKLRKRPLVIVLHDRNGGAARVRRRLGLEELPGARGAIFVYANAMGGAWEETSSAAANRDVVALRDLIARILADRRADPRRIFLVGVGAGGELALRSACSQAGLPVAGVAAINTSAPADLAATCQPTGAPAFVAVDHRFAPPDAKHPPSDMKVADMKAAEALAQQFARAARCAAEAPPAPFAKARKATIISFSGCKAPVAQIHILGPNDDHGHDAASLRDEGQVLWEVLTRAGA